jgi:NAD(P)-dependent dehydrogenase (short-subunit alcohol dehydrogenase family)
VVPLTSLAGKVVFITGVSRGIGRAVAPHFARAGCRVVATARSAEAAEQVAAAIRAAGGAATAARCDVADETSIDAAFTTAERAFGAVDILVNNAGVGGYGQMAEVAPADWRRALDVNLTGAFLCTRRAVPGMRTRGWGRILNLTTGLAQLTIEGSGPYAVAKAGLEHFTRLLDTELGPYDIRAIAFSPGTAKTDMYDEWNAFRKGDAPPAVPTERIAPMMVYLCATDRPVGGQVVGPVEIRAWMAEERGGR